MTNIKPIFLALAVLFIGGACLTTDAGTRGQDRPTMPSNDKPQSSAPSNDKSQPAAPSSDKTQPVAPPMSPDKDSDGAGLVVREGVVRPATADNTMAAFPGEVYNSSGSPMYFIKVVFEFYDAAGNLVLQDSAYTHTHADPGSVATYEYLMDANDLNGKTWSSYKFSVSGLQYKPKHAPKTRVAGELLNLSVFGDYAEMSGTVKNIGDVDCLRPEAVVAMYNADGKVLTAVYVPLVDSNQEMIARIAPGQSLPFTAFVRDYGTDKVTVRANCSLE